MPETEGCEHLIEYLFRLRPGIANGMGYIGQSWQEIESWSRLVKIPLTGWEAETLAKMSDAYCGQYAISSKKDCVAPWSKMAERNIEVNRDKVAEGTLKAFERAAKKTPAKKRAR